MYIGSDLTIDYRDGWLITLEDDVAIVSGSSILRHDASSFGRLGVTWAAPPRVLKGAYVGSRCVLLPSVTIGAGAVDDAASVVSRSVPSGTVAVGSPARVVGAVEGLDSRRRAALESCGSFETKLVYHHSLDPQAGAARRRSLGEHGVLFRATDGAEPLTAALSGDG